MKRNQQKAAVLFTVLGATESKVGGPMDAELSQDLSFWLTYQFVVESLHGREG